METLDETSTAVLQVFGRAPLVEDWRCVGRWAYAAAWLAEDHATARELVRARLAGAAGAATSAAMAAGRGDAERFALVSALARLPEAIESGSGALADSVEWAIDEAAARLADDGAALRAATGRERAAFAPRFRLEAFDAALRELGPDRHVLLREAAAHLDEGLLGARGSCPALRALRLFLQATLALDANEAVVTSEGGPASAGGEPVTTLGLWLSADLALTARRATGFGAAWAGAARVSGDALSKTLAGLTSGAMLANNVVEALGDDPWALVLALAMTTEPEHASAILDCGAQAQADRRVRAARSVSAWATQAGRADDLERRLGMSVPVSYEDREGHLDCSSAGNVDLFSAWHVFRRAEEARASLRAAMEKATGVESARRREAVRESKASLEGLRGAYEAAVEAARGRLQATTGMVVDATEDEGAHRGCVFGFGAGCSVMATYAAVGLVMGTGGIVGKIAPLVVGIAALPVGAAIFLQIAHGIRRTARAGEATRRRSAATAEFERARQRADGSLGIALAQGREALEAAEKELQAFERQLGTDVRAAT